MCCEADLCSDLSAFVEESSLWADVRRAPLPFDSARRLPLQVSSETLPCHNGSVGTRRNKGKDGGWGPVWALLEPKSVPLQSPPPCECGCVDAVRCEDTAVLPVAAGKYLPLKRKKKV